MTFLVPVWLALTVLMVGFALGTVFGASIITLRRPWYRPLSPAARQALQRHGRHPAFVAKDAPLEEDAA